MRTEPKKLVVIVGETAIERRLSTELVEAGVQGFTVVEARGWGARGLRSGELSETSNVQFEVVCSAAVAERVLKLVEDRYLPHFAVVVFVLDAEVLRGAKY